jgi:hypothetical protein
MDDGIHEGVSNNIIVPLPTITPHPRISTYSSKFASILDKGKTFLSLQIPRRLERPMYS